MKKIIHIPLIFLLCFSTVIQSLASSALTDTSESPSANIRAVGLKDVRWTEGFWAQRLDGLRDRSIPAMWEIMSGSEYKPYLQHFLIAAGAKEGRYRGAPFNDGDFYKFLEAACLVLSQENDPELQKIVEMSIDAISKAQREDGYIHTPVLIAQRNGDTSVQPFQNRHNFEVYNMGHLLTAACVHYRVTGRDNFLNIAKRTAEFLYKRFRDPTPELAGNSICPSHYMGMVELYRTTHDSRYLKLARQFLDMRALVEDGGDDNQDLIPFFEQHEAVGHAVRANYLYAGATDLWMETGDPRFQKPLESIWQNVVQKKMYLTGACGALYDGASPFGSKKQSNITRVHQSYGHNYELPNTTAHGETCAAIGNILWNWRMFLATGEARYIDVLETTLYNATLSGVSLEGSDYFYVNPLRNVDPLPTNLRWSRTRVLFVTSFCCPPNLLRTIAGVHGYAYGIDEDGILVNLYGSSELSTTIKNQSVLLKQSSNYPWDGKIRVKFESSSEESFSMKFRIPGWTESARISVNGDVVNTDFKRGQYAEVRRRWKSGDVIELDLPMPVQLIEAHPLVEENRNQVAIQRGPIVYCLESPDLPKGTRVQKMKVPSDVVLTPQFEQDLLGGVMAIEGRFLSRHDADWDGKLYRQRDDITESLVDVRLIPYYAWANRGMSEMSVWLPVR